MKYILEISKSRRMLFESREDAIRYKQAVQAAVGHVITDDEYERLLEKEADAELERLDKQTNPKKEKPWIN